MKITCVIPAFNEEKHITQVIAQVRPFVQEIIVVDDCSQDKTAALAKQSGVIVIQHAINRGQGASLQTGTEHALDRQADIIVHFDADNQFQAKEITDIIEPIIQGQAEAVLGSRFLGKKSNLPWQKKYLIMPLARLVNRIFFNINLSDPQSGFRALNRATAQKIKITNDGMAHCSEILYQLFKNKIKVKEVPITVVYHQYGQKFSGGLQIIKDLIIQKIIK